MFNNDIFNLFMLLNITGYNFVKCKALYVICSLNLKHNSENDINFTQLKHYLSIIKPIIVIPL